MSDTFPDGKGFWKVDKPQAKFAHWRAPAEESAHCLSLMFCQSFCPSSRLCLGAHLVTLHERAHKQVFGTFATLLAPIAHLLPAEGCFCGMTMAMGSKNQQRAFAADSEAASSSLNTSHTKLPAPLFVSLFAKRNAHIATITAKNDTTNATTGLSHLASVCTSQLQQGKNQGNEASQTAQDATIPQIGVF